MNQNYQKVKEILEEKGIRPTSQRLEMAHLLLKKHQHLQAEEVFHLVNSHFPHASRATIFNNLKLFSEKGILGSLEVKSGTTHFDSNTNRHHHAVLENSGKIIDVDLSENLEKQVLAELTKSFFEKTGRKLENSKIVITLKGN